jgi:hypothetical protein
MLTPGGNLDIAAPDGLLDVLHREPASRELGGVEPDPHGKAPLAEDPGLTHARERLQPALHQPVADVRELKQVVVGAGEREPEKRLGVGVLLGHDRLFHILGQALAHPRHLVAGVLRRGLDIAVEVELEADVADAFLARAGEGAEPLHRAQLLFQDVGDRRLDHLRVGAWQHRAHRDDRGVHVGELAHRQSEIAQHAEQHERQTQHAGQHRPANRQV